MSPRRTVSVAMICKTDVRCSIIGQQRGQATDLHGQRQLTCAGEAVSLAGVVLWRCCKHSDAKLELLLLAPIPTYKGVHDEILTS